MFEFVEEALDEVTLFVEFGIERRRLAPIGPGRDVGDCAAVFDLRSDVVGIVGLVSKNDAALGQPPQQASSGLAVVGLARGKREPDRPAAGIDDGVDFGRQSASTAAHTTISTVFFEFAAC